MANTIKIKRGLSSNLDNLTLQEGELATTTDTRKLYIGNADGTKTELGQQGPQGVRGTKWWVGDFYSQMFDDANNGDLLLNTSEMSPGEVLQFYDGMWDSVANIRGPQGPQGDTGATGPAGANAIINGQNTLNILAGTNISLDQQGTDLTINATGGGSGATYTAGTNIEITEAGVINNTIPYSKNSDNNGFALGPNSSSNASLAIVIGRSASASGSTAIGIGQEVSANGYESIAIGRSASTLNGNDGAIALGTYTMAKAEATLAIGYSAVAEGYGSIAIGTNATCEEANTMMIGDNSVPINKVQTYTSGGLKTLATEDYVTNAISTAIGSALGGSY